MSDEERSFLLLNFECVGFFSRDLRDGSNLIQIMLGFSKKEERVIIIKSTLVKAISFHKL